jgi:hypothetical protein
MKKKRFICRKCEESFVVEVFETGEAEKKRLPAAPVRCPKCGGRAEPE